MHLNKIPLKFYEWEFQRNERKNKYFGVKVISDTKSKIFIKI